MAPDLLALLGNVTQLRKAAGTDGGEWAGACPWCGGEDRFRVWPAADRPHWWCRQCQRGGDAIDFLRQHDRLSFQEAAAAVGRDLAAPRPARVIDDNPPSPAWQKRARHLAKQCQDMLWSPACEAALRYLREQRGLSDETIRAAGLGYNALDRCDAPECWGDDGERWVFVPEGITIPGEAQGHLWYLKVRRPLEQKPKYGQPRGGKTALYGADSLHGRPVLILTEGELDCLLLRQVAGDLVDVATVGSASAPLGSRWLLHLLPARHVLACYDPDAAGVQGGSRLAKLFARVRIVEPPGTGDITDAWQAGHDLRAWVQSLLAEYVPPAPAPPVLRPLVPTRPIDEWNDEAARELIQYYLRRVEWAWKAIPEAQRDHALQVRLNGALTPIGVARQARDMMALRRALGQWEHQAQPIFAAYRAAHTTQKEQQIT